MKIENIEPLTTDSTPAIVRAFFDFVFESEQTGTEFPVDFDIVWPLAYSRKDPAKRALIAEFFEDEDYRIINKNLENHISQNGDMVSQLSHGNVGKSIHRNVDGESEVFRKNVDGRHRNPDGTIAEEKIFLSTKCMEFFVARKVRPIFEIYRQCRIEVARLHSSHGVPIRMERRRTPQQLQNETVLPILVAFIQQTGDYAGRVSDLKAELEHVAPHVARQLHWPKSASIFGACLSRLGPPLREYDIEFVHGSRWGSGQRVALHINRELTAQHSVPQLN